MPRFLDTTGLASLAIGVCDRCKFKFPYVDLRPDGNIPALRVCQNEGCFDNFDPYRLPARQPEKITIRFPRPDASVAENHDAIITETLGNSEISPEQGNDPNNGNLNNISP